MPIPPTYPARPVNGGPLERALPKFGTWSFEAKYNGWRAWVHTPTGQMFNRDNEPISIAHEFKPALARLTETFGRSIDGPPLFEWLDCEALERRHGIGRGSLIILDAPTLASAARTTYEQRTFTLGVAAAFHEIPIHKQINERIADDTVYLKMSWEWAGAPHLWDILPQCNAALGCEFFEGIVAKRNDSLYPVQLRGPGVEFPFWMKHRWAF